MNPRTYDVIVIEVNPDKKWTIGQVTVTEEQYRAEQEKRKGINTQIKYLPKHCAFKLAMEKFEDKLPAGADIIVKMI